MKVQAIQNTNFKGLFTDKSAQNGGNWRMEYQPYSWEVKVYQLWHHKPDFGMSPQVDLDMFADTLPDNEKQYFATHPRKNSWDSERGVEECKDIFDTKFYYQDFSRGIIRKTITELPAMDRENSLIVLNKKLAAFVKMKLDLMKHKTDDMDIAERINDSSRRYNEQSADVKKGYFSRKSMLEYSYRTMDEEFNYVKDKALTTAANFQDYVKLNQSIKKVKQQIQDNEAEIKLLKASRKSGNLIDISRRDIYDPNKALWDSIQEMIRTKTLETSKKLVALPHRAISMQEIIKALGNKIKGSDASAEIISYVDKLITSKI